ncbi:MAG: thioredoxin family protein [Gammaproteobacteria bacterium]|nr:thioredoxin family protein [Gammaproteobacteria bacterium]
MVPSGVTGLTLSRLRLPPGSATVKRPAQLDETVSHPRLHAASAAFTPLNRPKQANPDPYLTLTCGNFSPTLPTFDRPRLIEIKGINFLSTPLDQFDFHPTLMHTTGIALVTFSSVDCGSCRHLRQVMQVVAREQPAWQLFEVDAQRDAALTREFDVFHLPALFLFADGEFHCEIHAEATPAAIIAATLAGLAQPPKEAP